MHIARRQASSSRYMLLRLGAVAEDHDLDRHLGDWPCSLERLSKQ
jgi:hypothetical protein